MRLILIATTLCSLLAAPLYAACAGQSLLNALTEGEAEALQSRLDATPYAEGNHWRATRGDDVLHLIGTMHLSDDRLNAPADRLAPLVKSADLLLLEMTAVEEAELQASLQSDMDMLLLPDQTLPDLLPEEDWDQLAEAMRQRGLPPFMGARMRPWYVSMLLAIPPCLADRLEDRNGLDARLEAAAQDAGVRTMALEPFDTGFAAFADLPMDMQMLMIRSALSSPKDAEDLFETVLSSYFAETHGAGQIVLEVLSPRLTPLTEAETTEVFAVLDEALISGRNRAWIPVILQALDDTKGTVVAGFGAAHLGGEQGVLNLLKQEGFALERLPF
ncbi:TraB/GumN family protein [Antarctobacter jejuensis]|uniref:TraB/GumN family protein n=1 Tax=Antarctobacter jejuensis TaxID=1439938 RepID=UPI003FD0202A